MRSFDYIITDPEGMHARPAGMLVKQATGYDCNVIIEKDGKQVDAKRIFGIMGLGIKTGECVTVIVDGQGEDEAFAGLKSFFASNL